MINTVTLAIVEIELRIHSRRCKLLLKYLFSSKFRIEKGQRTTYCFYRYFFGRGCHRA